MLGGGLGGQILGMLGIASGSGIDLAGTGDMDIGSIVGSVAGGGVGGGVLLGMVGAVKKALVN